MFKDIIIDIIIWIETLMV